MQEHLPAQNYANAGASVGPTLCECRGIFQPEVMQMQGHLPARDNANVGASVSPTSMEIEIAYSSPMLPGQADAGT